jgi:hypothetical protein
MALLSASLLSLCCAARGSPQAIPFTRTFGIVLRLSDRNANAALIGAQGKIESAKEGQKRHIAELEGKIKRAECVPVTYRFVRPDDGQIRDLLCSNSDELSPLRSGFALHLSCSRSP